MPPPPPPLLFCHHVQLTQIPLLILCHHMQLSQIPPSFHCVSPCAIDTDSPLLPLCITTCNWHRFSQSGHKNNNGRSSGTKTNYNITSKWQLKPKNTSSHDNVHIFPWQRTHRCIKEVGGHQSSKHLGRPLRSVLLPRGRTLVFT